MILTENAIYNVLVAWATDVCPKEVVVVRFPVEDQEPSGLFVGIDIIDDEQKSDPYYCEEICDDGTVLRSRITVHELIISINVYDCGAFDLARMLQASLEDRNQNNHRFEPYGLSFSRSDRNVTRLREAISGRFKDRAQFRAFFRYQRDFCDDQPMADGMDCPEPVC